MIGFTLGMPGPWAKDNYEACDHYTTKIGGLPDWPVPEMDKTPGLLRCGVCGRRCCLVAQVYAPVAIDGLNIEERTIYVFGCLMPKCGSSPLSWRTIRVQKACSEDKFGATSKEVAPSTPSCESISNADNSWEKDSKRQGSDEEEVDDGSDEDLDFQALGRALMEASTQFSPTTKQKGHRQSKTVAKSSHVKPSIRPKDASIPVVPCFYTYSQEEPSLNHISAISAKYSSLSIKENPVDADDHGEEETWNGEAYEYDRALDVDRTYLKFKKRMDACPEQCFRYSFGGEPLLAAAKNEEPGTCSLCGAPRCYEMQLMPPLIYFLQEAADISLEQSLNDWSWMTLIVYTCSKSCSVPLHEKRCDSNGWTVVEEATFVQYE